MCMASTVSSALRRVLVLGSGFTSGPLVECLTRDGGIAVTVGMLYSDMQCIADLDLLHKHCVVMMYVCFESSCVKRLRMSTQCFGELVRGGPFYSLLFCG